MSSEVRRTGGLDKLRMIALVVLGLLIPVTGNVLLGAASLTMAGEPSPRRYLLYGVQLAGILALGLVCFRVGVRGERPNERLLLGAAVLVAATVALAV